MLLLIDGFFVLSVPGWLDSETAPKKPNEEDKLVEFLEVQQNKKVFNKMWQNHPPNWDYQKICDKKSKTSFRR